MLDINFTFFIQFLNFVVLMFILNVLLFKPVIAFMARRKAMIDQTLEEGRTAETAADETLKRYHDILAGARSAADARFAEVQVAIEEGHRGHLAEAELRADEVTTAREPFERLPLPGPVLGRGGPLLRSRQSRGWRPLRRW